MINPSEQDPQENTGQKTTKDIFKEIVLWINHNLKFLFIPGYSIKELSISRKDYLNSNYKKRKRNLFRSPLIIIGVTIIFILITLAIFQHWISPYTYEVATTRQLKDPAPPSIDHPLGTTIRGWDILARLIFGTRTVLIFIGLSSIFACIFGIIIGAIAGYYGGLLDSIVMRIMDIIQSFPGVVLAITFLVIYGSRFINIIIVYSIITIPYFANVIRSNFLKQKELQYVASAKVAGAGNFRIIFRHLLPNSIQLSIIVFSFNCCRVLLSLAVLAFFRIKDPLWIDWGTDIVSALNYTLSAPWALIFPSLMILFAVLGFLLLGDGLRDAFSLRDESF